MSPHADPNERRAYHRKWREAHRDAENKRGREYYALNRDAVCERTSKAQKNEAYKVRRKELQDKRLRERHAFIDEYKSIRGCCICGENHPVCLDFHHEEPLEKKTHGKQSTISTGIRKWSLERLMKELEKCVIVCSNCHRKIHAEMGWEWTHEV